MNDSVTPHNEPVRNRMVAIEAILMHFGHINRRPLQLIFGLSSAQVARDLQNYMKHAKGNMAYSGARKRYEKTEEFKAAFIELTDDHNEHD